MGYKIDTRWRDDGSSLRPKSERDITLPATGTATGGTTVYDSKLFEGECSVWNGASADSYTMGFVASGNTSVVPLPTVACTQNGTEFFFATTVGAQQAAYFVSPMPGASTNDTAMSIGAFNKITGANGIVLSVINGVADHTVMRLDKEANMVRELDQDEQLSLEFNSETQTVNITASASISMGFSNITGTTRLFGVAMRVDSALAGGETWDADWDNGGTIQNIATAEAVAQNTKTQKMFDYNNAAGVNDTFDIVLTRSSNPGVDAFTAQGTITAVAIYYKLNNLSNV